jgi:hypothetical protein
MRSKWMFVVHYYHYRMDYFDFNVEFREELMED